MPIFAVVNDFVMSTTLISKAIAEYFKTQPVVGAMGSGTFAPLFYPADQIPVS